jgi:hypothetical protein
MWFHLGMTVVVIMNGGQVPNIQRELASSFPEKGEVWRTA